MNVQVDEAHSRSGLGLRVTHLAVLGMSHRVQRNDGYGLKDQVRTPRSASQAME